MSSNVFDVAADVNGIYLTSGQTRLSIAMKSNAEVDREVRRLKAEIDAAGARAKVRIQKEAAETIDFL